MALAIMLGVTGGFSSEKGPNTVRQSEREIPVIAEVDVVIAGGTCAGVAAAEAAARAGAKVFLAGPRPFLGEDLCATLMLEPGSSGVPQTPLAKALFGVGQKVTPNHVKTTLARTLIGAGVQFTLMSYVTDVLRDSSGRVCGVVIANRSGRQAVVAKIVIDATPYAWVCRQAGCAFTPYKGGPVRFTRNMMEGAKGDSVSENKRGDETTFTIHTRELNLAMPDFSYASLSAAEHIARDRTASDKVIRGAESLFCVPPFSVVCEQTQKEFQGGADISLGHFRPKETERIYVLNGCADIPRETAGELLKPGGMIGIGMDIGKAAAREAKALSQPSGVRVSAGDMPRTQDGDILEDLSAADRSVPGLRPVPCGERSIPVLETVDVLVIGGGVSGAAAAIASARSGVRTLVVEYQEGLGGMGAVGLIGRPYHGRKVGFAAEAPWPDNIESKMEWYRSEIRRAGGGVWLGVMGCGAFVDHGTVRGAVVCTPEGRGVVLAKTVIDGTGNGDIAIAAGAGYMYGAIEDGDIALQGAGLSARPVSGVYMNSDYLLVDESDYVDAWRALVSAQIKNEKSFDTCALIQTRERRRVIGDHVLSYLDQIAGRTYPDSIVFSKSDYDSHGYPSSPFFALLPHDEESRKMNHPAPGGSCYTPYRCLLPKGLEGVLVIGLGISMDRDAAAMVRMQHDMANQGYAAGLAAAMAAKAGISPRKIDVRALQKKLIEIGSLPDEVLSHKDSFPLPAEAVRGAVEEYGKAENPAAAGRPLAVIMTHREAALPYLQEAFQKSAGKSALQYAMALGVLGDRIAAPALVEALNAVKEWDDKIRQGVMADHSYLPTPVDGIILALGYAGDRSAVPAIVRLADSLDAQTALSHHRAVGLALERLGDPAAARPLADLLNKPAMRGYALTALPSGGKAEDRASSIREITLARALYRCGDHQGLGRKTLEQYAHDIRGLFSRHARAVLKKE